jgi:hypothetical protein
VVRGTSAQCGLHADNMEFNTQNEEYYNYMHIFNCVFLLYIMCDKSMLITIGGIYLKIQFTT